MTKNNGKKNRLQAASKTASIPISVVFELVEDLVKLKEAAPPDPEEETLAWLSGLDRVHKGLGPKKMEALLAFAKESGIKASSGTLGVIVDMTAAEHIGPKQRKKYVNILQRTSTVEFKPMGPGLSKFVRDHGGINRCAAGHKAISKEN